MCDRTTPPAQRAMCGCYSRRAVVAVLGAAGVVLAAWLVPSAELVAFVAAGVVAAVVVALAWHRRDGVWLVHRTHHWAGDETQALPGQAPAEVPWWDRAQIGGRP